MAQELNPSGVNPDGMNLNGDESIDGDDPAASPKEDMIPKSEVTNLLKALEAERKSRKQYEKESAERQRQLEKFAEINPDEYRKLQEEAAIAERDRFAAEERTMLLEEKYGAQTREAKKEADSALAQLQDFRKRYALEKVFFSAGGRTDAADGISFFDMLADRLGPNFRLEGNGTVTVIDRNGDPILDSETGKRMDPAEYLATFKQHPIYGTFFRGSKGSGSGLSLNGTGESAVATEDIESLPVEAMFERAFA